MFSRSLPVTALLLASLLPSVWGQTAPTPKPPIVNDPALRIQLVATLPDVEACTTVCSDPQGAIYIGNDSRDGRLNSKEPVNSIVRLTNVVPPPGTVPSSERTRTVFADKIYSPAGSAWHDGYLYVLHDPLLTRFKDTDGDGIADVREDLVTSLGIEPNAGLNDHVVSGFTLGMDGFFYISVGDRGIYQAKSVKDGSSITLRGGGIVRVRPDGSQLEIFSTGTRNHLQVNLDAEDNPFTRDNTDDGNGWWTRLTHHIQGGFYGYPFEYQHAPNYGVTQPSQQTLDAIKRNGGGDEPAAQERFLPAMADFGGGSPTGGVCYLSDGLPEQYRGQHFFSEWGKAGIFATELARDGATFKLVNDTKLVEPEKGADFRPMQCSVAADGSILIADWGYGGWKSPKIAGAVWRLYWPEARPMPRLKDESQASIAELVAALGHPDRDQRLRAEWALAAKGEDALPLIIERMHDIKIPALTRIHALWTMHALGRPETASESVSKASGLIRQLLVDPEPSVRAQAARALGLRKESAAAEELGSLLADPSPVVRQAALLAIAQLPVAPAAVGEKAVAALKDSDPWIKWAAGLAALRHGQAEIERVLGGNDPVAQTEVWRALQRSQADDLGAATIFQKQALAKEIATRILAIRNLGRVAYQPTPYDGHWWGTQPVKNPAPLNRQPWEATSISVGVLSKALEDWDTGVRQAAAKAFSNFIMDDAGKDAGAALRTRLRTEGEPSVRRQIIEALGVQKDSQAVEVFQQIALDEKADPGFRDTAIGAVVNIGGEAAKKVILQLASTQLSPVATRQVIEAAGDLKVTAAAPAMLARVSDSDAAIRLAAVKTLNAFGVKNWPAGTTEAFLTALDDKDGKIGAAAAEALSNAKVKEVLPRFIALADKGRYRKETIGAIATLGGEEAIPVLIKMLGDKNLRIRADAARALRKYRDQVWPVITQKFLSNELPAEYEPEVRTYFDAGVITQWKMVGPFENVWEAVHPPETDALTAPDFSKKYLNAEGKEVGWTDVKADSDSGRVNLEQVYKTNGMVCAYAFLEIESTEEGDAKFLSGSDDQIAVWLNGKKVHDSGAASRGFNPDQDQVPIHFKAGKNQILVKIGNLSGSWEFAARIPGLDGTKFTPSKEPTPEDKQRAFALAANPDGSWIHPGNAAKGEKVFGDPQGPLSGLCMTCHAVKGKGAQIGPDLTVIGANYKRADLVTSILEPSKTIALGFDQVMIETAGGESFFGALRAENADALTVVGADGVKHEVKRTDVKNRTDMKTSLMPAGATLALKLEDFVDLVAYLESLKGK